MGAVVVFVDDEDVADCGSGVDLGMELMVRCVDNGMVCPGWGVCACLAASSML